MLATVALAALTPEQKTLVEEFREGGLSLDPNFKERALCNVDNDEVLLEMNNVTVM